MRYFKSFCILISFLPIQLFAGNICSKHSCPNGRRATTLCFIDPHVSTGVLRKATNAAKCGYFTEIVIAETTNDIKRRLEKIASECQSLDRLTFEGHGSDGVQLAGDLNWASAQELSEFGCLFNKDAEINYGGCSIGSGCAGDMLFYQTAKSLLPNGGAVWGPTFISSTFLPGVIPHFSLNGKSRRLNYKPSNRPPDNWTQTGLAISDGGSINERCSQELNGLLGDLNDAKAKATKKGCSSSYSYISSERLANYQQLKTRLPLPPHYMQSASSEAWYDLSSVLNDLKYQVRRYESCQPPSKESTGSSAVSEGVK